MASEKIDRVSANRRELRERHKPVEKNLDDEKTQRDILEPKTNEVELGGKTVKLHVLSGYAVRALIGLAGEIYTDVSTGGGSPMFRLLQRHYLSRFEQLLAAAHAKAGELEPDVIDKIAAEIDEATAGAKGAAELARAFVVMLDMNEVMESLQAPKSEPRRAATP